LSLIATKFPSSPPSAEQERHILNSLTSQSQTFIPNVGQVATPSHFYSCGAGYGFYFTPEAVNMAFIEYPAKQNKPDHHHRRFRPDEDQLETQQVRQGIALSLRFIGSNPSANIKARKEEPGIVNFFIGNDPTKWQTNLRSYAEIVYSELWPNIDMVFRNTGGVLKYEFIIQPGANLSNIRLTYDGVDTISTDADGNLLIRTPIGILTEQRPVSYQPVDGLQLPVATEFTLEGQSDGTLGFGFNVDANYDSHHPLVIDPGLVYSTYLGGSQDFDDGFGIALDTSDNAYVVGYTRSADFPTTMGAFQTNLNGIANVFITKFNPDGALVYSTYLGGSSFDQGYDIAVDTSGSAYVTGITGSADFPTTSGAFQTSFKGGFIDAFITKLNSTGSELIYSTYLGGLNAYGNGIAIDTSENAYITGEASAFAFPITPGAFQTIANGLSDAFVTKLNPSGSELIYSTYLGGSSNLDIASDIVIDTSGNAYVTGFTESTDFPTTPDAFQTTSNAGGAFVTKLNPAGSALIYSTYLGGSIIDTGSGIAVDTSGSAYVTGTGSSDFPTTPGAFQTALKDGGAFITKLNPAGSELVYSTYLGSGSGNDITVDTYGNAYVTGITASIDFPTTSDAFQPSLKGSFDAFILKLNPTGSALVYSTYFGGSDVDEGVKIATDTSGNAYITGVTQSTDFPTTPGAFQTTLIDQRNAFVAKLQTAPNESMGFLGLGADQL
jgi:hypothetical protein